MIKQNKLSHKYNHFILWLLLLLFLSIQASSSQQIYTTLSSLTIEKPLIAQKTEDSLNPLDLQPSELAGIMSPQKIVYLGFVQTQAYKIYDSRTRQLTTIGSGLIHPSSTAPPPLMWMNGDNVYFFANALDTLNDSYCGFIYSVNANKVIYKYSYTIPSGDTVYYLRNVVIQGNSGNQNMYRYSNLTRVVDSTFSFHLTNPLSGETRVYNLNSSSLQENEYYTGIYPVDDTHFLMEKSLYSYSYTYYLYDFTRNNSYPLRTIQLNKHISTYHAIFVDNSLELWQKSPTTSNSLNRLIYPLNGSSSSQTIQFPFGVMELLEVWPNNNEIHAYYTVDDNTHNNVYYLTSTGLSDFTHIKLPSVTPFIPGNDPVVLLSKESNVLLIAHSLSEDATGQLLGAPVKSYSISAVGPEDVLKDIKSLLLGFSYLDFSWLKWTLIIGVPVLLLASIGGFVWYKKKKTLLKNKPLK